MSDYRTTSEGGLDAHYMGRDPFGRLSLTGHAYTRNQGYRIDSNLLLCSFVQKHLALAAITFVSRFFPLPPKKKKSKGGKEAIPRRPKFRFKMSHTRSGPISDGAKIQSSKRVRVSRSSSKPNGERNKDSTCAGTTCVAVA